jgi:hypothetical protein
MAVSPKDIAETRHTHDLFVFTTASANTTQVDEFRVRIMWRESITSSQVQALQVSNRLEFQGELLLLEQPPLGTVLNHLHRDQHHSPQNYDYQ